MDTLNSNPTETVLVPTPVPVEMPITPEATAVLAEPVAIVAPAAVPATVPVAAVKMELPKTTGQTVGGWNRFAGYNPNAAKNKPKEGRGGPGSRR